LPSGRPLALTRHLGSFMDTVFPPTFSSPPPRLPTLAETVDNFFPPFSLTDNLSPEPARPAAARWPVSGHANQPHGQLRRPLRKRSPTHRPEKS
jgi:hypothetical protein